MSRRARIRTAIAASILLAGLAISLRGWFDPVKRVAREHGIMLPATASNVVCGGDAWMAPRLDCGAVSTFEIPASELPGFLASLRVRRSTSGPGDTTVPGNPQYTVAVPWASSPPDFAYDCESPTGDFLTVRTWALSSSSVGVLLYTDWN